MQLSLAVALFSSAPVAPCARPERLPAELALMHCPLRAAPARCTARCPPSGQYLDLHYRGAPRPLAAAWASTLAAAGWRTRTTTGSLDLDRPGERRRPAILIRASKAGARLETVVLATGSDESLVTLTFTPAPALRVRVDQFSGRIA